MRIGIGPFPLEAEPGRDLHDVYSDALARAERAERLGLDAVWVDGNHFTPEAHGPSPMVVAAALAARTRRVAIGVATLTLSLGEHPLHVAEEALFLDSLSGGRLVLGVGLGYRDAEFIGFGVSAAERRPRFDDALAILRAAFAEPPEFPFHGSVHRVDAAIVPHPRPVRPGGPPIWIGGGWSAGAVRRIARMGAPMIAQFFEAPERIARKLAVYREAAAPDAAGLRSVPAIRDVVVGAPARVLPALVAVYRRYAAWGMPVLGRPTDPREIGPDEAAAIAWVGDERLLRERVAELAAAGVTDLLARVDLPGVPAATIDDSLRALAEIRSPG